MWLAHYDSNSPPLPLPPGDDQGPLATSTGLFLLGVAIVIIAAAVLLSS